MAIVNKKTYFDFEESVSNPGKYLISIKDYDGFHCHGTMGSYNVLFARLMNMTYAQFLRFCRDILGAELYGRDCLYIIPLFSKTTGVAREFIKLLNNLANTVIWEREHPNWEEHQQEMSEHDLKIYGIIKESLDDIVKGDNGAEGK